MTDLIVLCRPGKSAAKVLWKGEAFEGVIGKGGPIAAADKLEGDGCTPLGRWPMVRGHYRGDRRGRPAGTLDWQPLAPGQGYEDDVDSPLYNTFTTLPEGHTEYLWEEGNRYDLVVFLGYNVDPVLAGNGSAILLHGLGTKDYTAGCLAMNMNDLNAIAGQFEEGDGVEFMLVQDE